MIYDPSEFTDISASQIKERECLTQNPLWKNQFNDLSDYFSLHEEGFLDKNLSYLLSNLLHVVVHGNIKDEKLSTHLQHFDIRRLVHEGPYANDILSTEAQQLILNSLNPNEKIIDIHLHLIGFDEGNFFNPDFSAHQLASFKNHCGFLALRYAAGISSVIGSTHEARKRLHLYAAHFPHLMGMVLPIHKAIHPDGTVDWKKTTVFLNNSSALLTARSFDNYHKDSSLFPAVSIHPFDKKWKEKLQAAHNKGIRLIKWMPPQSIPPDSDDLDDFYRSLAELKMILLAHSGIEHAIPLQENNPECQDWGNPLRFKKPLKLGVNVILAHCGHKDLIPDLDDSNQNKTPGYELFLRLARETHQKNKTGEWKGKLYGDLAAVTTHYGPEFIKQLLKVSNEEGIRFIYGSDYPYTNLIQPQHDAYEICAEAEILNPSYTSLLKEIREWNPLLANYVFTQHLVYEFEGKTLSFPQATFTGKFKDAELELVDQKQWEYWVKSNV